MASLSPNAPPRPTKPIIRVFPPLCCLLTARALSKYGSSYKNCAKCSNPCHIPLRTTAQLSSPSSTNTTSNSSGDIKVLPQIQPVYLGADIVELVAKRMGTKVSAQWSNDEAVHQVLVDLLTVEETGELLHKVSFLWGLEG